MNAMEHAIITSSLQKEKKDEEFKPLSMEPSEEYIDGIPLSIKKKSIENNLTVALQKQKNKLDSLEKDDRPDKEERIYVTKQNIELICELRQINIQDSIDYEFVNYCYNSGFFRRPEQVLEKEAEIKQIRENIRISQIRNSEEYNKHYHPFLFYCAWFFGPPVILGIICEGFSYGIFAGLFYWAFLAIPLAIIAAIATWIYCDCHASKFKVPMSEFAQEALIAGTITGCTIMYHDRKKINKEIRSKRNVKI